MIFNFKTSLIYFIFKKYFTKHRPCGFWVPNDGFVGPRAVGQLPCLSTSLSKKSLWNVLCSKKKALTKKFLWQKSRFFFWQRNLLNFCFKKVLFVWIRNERNSLGSPLSCHFRLVNIDSQKVESHATPFAKSSIIRVQNPALCLSCIGSIMTRCDQTW